MKFTNGYLSCVVCSIVLSARADAHYKFHATDAPGKKGHFWDESAVSLGHQNTLDCDNHFWARLFSMTAQAQSTLHNG